MSRSASSLPFETTPERSAAEREKHIRTSVAAAKRTAAQEIQEPLRGRSLPCNFLNELFPGNTAPRRPVRRAETGERLIRKLLRASLRPQAPPHPAIHKQSTEYW